MDIQEIFARLGLDRHAHEVYEVLLTTREPVLVAHIAAMAGITRAQTYRSLADLLKERLVTKIAIGKRVGYRAADPSLIEERFAEATARAGKAVARATRQREKDVPEYVRFFKGFSGIRAVFDDVIAHTPKSSTFYRYTSERDLAAVNRYLSPTYRKERDRKKLERLVISNPVSARQKRPRLERFIKYMEPKNALFDQNVIQLVYGKRLAFINLNDEEAVIIENQALADFQKVIFTQLYRKL